MHCSGYSYCTKQPKQVLETKCGFQQSVEFHISPDLTGSRFFYGFEYIAGYRINNTFFAGGGTGVEGYIDSIAMPIYCTARAYLLPKSRWQPLISLSLGTVVALSSSGWRCHTPIALHINPNVGINYRINQKYSCYCGIGYMMRETKKNYGRDISTNCLTIRAGFTF